MLFVQVYVGVATVAGDRVTDSSERSDRSEGSDQSGARTTLVLVRTLQHDADAQTKYDDPFDHNNSQRTVHNSLLDSGVGINQHILVI